MCTGIPLQSRAQDINNLKIFTIKCKFEITGHRDKTYASGCLFEILDMKD